MPQQLQDVPTLLSECMVRLSPGHYDHHRQATIIAIQISDPLRKRPLSGASDPPGKLIGKPELCRPYVLQISIARTGGLPHVAHQPEVPRIRQCINRNFAGFCIRMVNDVCIATVTHLPCDLQCVRAHGRCKSGREWILYIHTVKVRQ
jgi:hypothetical protein